MSYSDSMSTKTPDGKYEENHDSGSQDNPGSDAELSQFDGELNQLIELAEDWVRENHTMAMLGGFGLGVFIGVLLRR